VCKKTPGFSMSVGGASDHAWERQAIFVFGIAFVVILIVLAIFFPNPTPFQYVVFRAVLALAAAGVAALIPGLLNVDIPAVKAGGALAVFVLIFYFSPAGLVVPPQPLPVPPSPAPSAAPAPIDPAVARLSSKSFKICFGGGGGSNCLAGADVKLDCDQYHGWTQEKWDTLAGNLCGYTVTKIQKYPLVQTQNNGGGGCGWTAYQLTCP
jgi:hypothetical protein